MVMRTDPTCVNEMADVDIGRGEGDSTVCNYHVMLVCQSPNKIPRFPAERKVAYELCRGSVYRFASISRAIRSSSEGIG